MGGNDLLCTGRGLAINAWEVECSVCEYFGSLPLFIMVLSETDKKVWSTAIHNNILFPTAHQLRIKLVIWILE